MFRVALTDHPSTAGSLTRDGEAAMQFAEAFQRRH
jgi:hypothetical protein